MLSNVQASKGNPEISLVNEIMLDPPRLLTGEGDFLNTLSRGRRCLVEKLNPCSSELEN
jgi:hypothetical protein